MADTKLLFATMDGGAISIYPCPADKGPVHALESSYGGILAVNLTCYANARRDSPLFESAHSILSIAQSERIVVLFPSESNIIQQIYNTYKPLAKYTNVYDLNCLLYCALDAAFTE